MADHPLRKWRKRRKLTLIYLANQVGVTPSHLSEIENGNNRPSLDLAVRLHRLTKLPFSAFTDPTTPSLVDRPF